MQTLGRYSNPSRGNRGCVCVVNCCLCCLYTTSSSSAAFLCGLCCLYTTRSSSSLSVWSVWPILVCVCLYTSSSAAALVSSSLSVWSVTKCGSHSGASAHSSPTADKSHIIQTCNSSSFINQISDKANTSKGKSNQVPDGKRWPGSVLNCTTIVVRRCPGPNLLTTDDDPYWWWWGWW